MFPLNCYSVLYRNVLFSSIYVGGKAKKKKYFLTACWAKHMKSQSFLLLELNARKQGI